MLPAKLFRPHPVAPNFLQVCTFCQADHLDYHVERQLPAKALLRSAGTQGISRYRGRIFLAPGSSRSIGGSSEEFVPRKCLVFSMLERKGLWLKATESVFFLDDGS